MSHVHTCCILLHLLSPLLLFLLILLLNLNLILLLLHFLSLPLLPDTLASSSSTLLSRNVSDSDIKPPRGQE